MLTPVANAYLANPNYTVNTGAGLSGGGTNALGSSGPTLTLNTTLPSGEILPSPSLTGLRTAVTLAVTNAISAGSGTITNGLTVGGNITAGTPGVNAAINYADSGGGSHTITGTPSGLTLSSLSGLTVASGLTTTDSALLGSELTSSSGWTATNWTGTYGTGFTHTTGNTSPLSYSIPGIAVNNYYQISFAIVAASSSPAGSVSVSIGSTLVEAFTGQFTGASSATWTVGPRVNGTGAFTFTPTTALTVRLARFPLS